MEYENPHYAFVRWQGVLLGLHPADEKSPGGIGGTTVYWEVANLAHSTAQLEAAGATRYRGPMTTSLSAHAAMLKDPFGCCIGLNQSSAASRAATSVPE
ncbi:MAG: VOC family protein [Vogesella sp.]|uniref:VOC family protein n=1 Tax=Vogesella sp. TaxID=1904252 RepID=UPI003F3A9F41